MENRLSGSVSGNVDTNGQLHSQPQSHESFSYEGNSTPNRERGARSGVWIAGQDANGRKATRSRKEQSIRRACNECRQQKLRCDVITQPFSACSRCRRFQLECKIDANFKRIEKRRSKRGHQQEQQTIDGSQPQPSVAASNSSLLQMESIVPEELDTVEYQAEPSMSRDLPTVPTTTGDIPSMAQSTVTQWSDSTRPLQIPTHPVIPHRSGSDTSFTLQRQDSFSLRGNASASSGVGNSRRLDGVELNLTEVEGLFKIFFEYYHPFLPFLDPLKPPNHYYQSSRLLFWTMISIASRRYSSDLTLLPSLAVSVPRLLWSVLQSVPQNYHDIKALCLLCTWPFPMNSSSSDPTFMLSGTMMHLAMQVGLHRPSQAQDFSQFSVKLPPEELQDRESTWMTCKLVAYCVATGYGQPTPTIFDETFDSHVSRLPNSEVLQHLMNRLNIQRFCGRVAKSLNATSNPTHPGSDSQSSGIMNLLSEELSQLEVELTNTIPSIVQLIYLRCAQLHLRLYSLFDMPSTPKYITSILSLYESCQALLGLLLTPGEDILSYCPNYVFQMTSASGFVILKLVQSPATEYVDAAASKSLFNSAILAVRSMSVSNNDLPGRLAEVLAQLKARGNRAARNKTDWQILQLNVRSRMSMSIVFDSLWEWRRGFEMGESKAPSTQNTVDVTPNQSLAAVHAERRNGSSSSMAVQHDFDLNDLVFDDFYPMNWIVENATDMTSLVPTQNYMTK